MDSADGSGGGMFGFGGIDGLQTMGILGALKTGDMQTDMIVAMVIPVVIRMLFRAISQIDGFTSLEKWIEWLFKKPDMHERFIRYKSEANDASNADEDTENTILLKAIQMYLNSQVKLDLTVANLDLTSLIDQNAQIDFGQDDEDSEYYDSNLGRWVKNRKDSVASVLSRHTIIKKPMNEEWHDLGIFGDKEGDNKNDGSCTRAMVELKIEENETKEGGRPLLEKTFHFRSTSGGAIDAFINTAYDWYMEQLRENDEECRYFYDLKSAKNENGSYEQTKGALFSRFRLSDEKTFESLFFREKDSLLALIDHFQNRSGKYAIKGYPHKLGLLLYGPPGSGKTSLIKSLANYTKRSIVNVSLSKISTNAELSGIFFDSRKNVEGEDVPVPMTFNDVIYVMEDVDAASKVVRRRDGKRTADVVQTEQVELPYPNWWHLMLQSNESDCKELVELLMEKSERLKEEAFKPEAMQSINKRMMALPGLGLIGEGQEDHAAKRVGEEAIEASQKLMDQYATVDRFLAFHSRTLKSLVEAGADLDDAFVDELLGISSSSDSFSAQIQPKRTVSRDISYSKYNESTSAITNVAQMLSAAPEKKFIKAGQDELNLTGLLNVLDGVVDTPGRILIMTTNHPEQLDPALIRPGRIDKKMRLAYMAAPDVMAMIEHYFQTTLTQNQKNRIEEVISGSPIKMRPQLNLTPAQVEQMAAEHDEVDEMIGALEEKGAPSQNTKFTTSMSAITFGH